MICKWLQAPLWVEESYCRVCQSSMGLCRQTEQLPLYQLYKLSCQVITPKKATASKYRFRTHGSCLTPPFCRGRKWSWERGGGVLKVTPSIAKQNWNRDCLLPTRVLPNVRYWYLVPCADKSKPASIKKEGKNTSNNQELLHHKVSVKIKWVYHYTCFEQPLARNWELG